MKYYSYNESSGNYDEVNGTDNACDFFEYRELACKGYGKLKFHDGFLEHLVILRTIWNKVMIVNSCCRTPEHNKLVGGHYRSLHLTINKGHPAKGCMAIDISTSGWDKQSIDNFVKLALSLDWSVGISSTFIHIDRRVDIGLKKAIFFYSSVNASKYSYLKQFV